MTAIRRIEITEPLWVRILLITGALTSVGVLLVLPLVTIFGEALSRGWAIYWNSISEFNSLSAIKLTLITAAIAVPLNLAFGISAAWAIGKFDFPGKKILMTLIDLPFTVSPLFPD